MKESMGDIMLEAYKRGWITTRDGNISARKGNKFYITPSGGVKYQIRVDDILKGSIDLDQVVFNLEGREPSGELEMHRLLHNNSELECMSVVHLHPTYTIAAIERGWDLVKLASEFPEISRYTRVGKSTEILPICSNKLAKATLESFLDGEKALSVDIVGQARHGVTAVGKYPREAFEHIERLEHICKIIMIAGTAPSE